MIMSGIFGFKIILLEFSKIEEVWFLGRNEFIIHFLNAFIMLKKSSNNINEEKNSFIYTKNCESI